ncbi:hypothetical protein WDU94_012208 [Cyamophila willieti]
MLFLHSFTGCDTTSSAFRKKVIFCRLYLKSPEIQEAAAVFSNPHTSQEDVHKAGVICFLKWTYHQVQQWLGNNLPPQDWCWTMKGDVLVTTQTEDPSAPEVLLKTIFCRCTKDCSSGKCICQKAMLVCNTACSHCQGSCLNGVPLFDENEYEDDISPPASPLASPISSQLTFWDEDEDIAGPSNPKRPRVT